MQAEYAAEGQRVFKRSFEMIGRDPLGKEDLVSVDASQYDICVSDIKCEQHGSSFLYGFPVPLKERHCRKAPG